MSNLGHYHPEIELQDRDGILAIQRKKLAVLGKRLGEFPEWVAHFRKAGIQPTDLVDHATLAAMPTLEKSDLRERNAATKASVMANPIPCAPAVTATRLSFIPVSMFVLPLTGRVWLVPAFASAMIGVSRSMSNPSANGFRVRDRHRAKACHSSLLRSRRTARRGRDPIHRPDRKAPALCQPLARPAGWPDLPP